MNSESENDFVTHGFGFPVRILNAPWRHVFGERALDIEYGELSEIVLRKIIFQGSNLTGAQVKFIRNHLGMTLEKFAERFGVTHPAVVKWESKGAEATAMGMSTELHIRLEAFNGLRHNEVTMQSFYSTMESGFSLHTEEIVVDLATDRNSHIWLNQIQGWNSAVTHRWSRAVIIPIDAANWVRNDTFKADPASGDYAIVYCSSKSSPPVVSRETKISKPYSMAFRRAEKQLDVVH